MNCGSESVCQLMDASNIQLLFCSPVPSPEHNVKERQNAQIAPKSSTLISTTNKTTKTIARSPFLVLLYISEILIYSALLVPEYISSGASGGLRLQRPSNDSQIFVPACLSPLKYTLMTEINTVLISTQYLIQSF
jgi:hypothetical protein